MTREETFALIVGGGPVGLTAAIELGWRKLPAILVSENLATAQHPKCNNTNARSMEHFRRLGVARDIRAVGLPVQSARENAYVTRFCGYELARMTRPYPLMQQGRMSGGSAEFQKTPEPPHTISQIRLEPILKQHAERAVDVRFGWRLVSFEQDTQGVTATVENVTGGERRQIAARFMIAADGAKSLVRRELGIGMTGEDGTVERAFMGGTMLSYYIRGPALMAQSGRAPAVITWIINREVRGFMYLQDGREHWIVRFQVPKGVDLATLEPHAVVRSMIGADAEFEILSGGPWTGGMALVAEQYRSGRIFLLGDAAHLFTPLGGFGMNTGIGDVMNLGWKLSAVHRGWAGERLLDTFDQERRPIGARNSALGVHCAREMSAWPVPEDVEAAGEAAEARRRAFGAFCVEDDKDQYNTTGLQFGERYEEFADRLPGRNVVAARRVERLHAGRAPWRAAAALLARRRPLLLRSARGGFHADGFRAERHGRLRGGGARSWCATDGRACRAARGRGVQPAGAGAPRPAHRVARAGRAVRRRDGDRPRPRRSLTAERLSIRSARPSHPAPLRARAGAPRRCPSLR